MILDFTIINKVDGLSIYAEKILNRIYCLFNKNNLFLFHKNFYDKNICQYTNHSFINNMIFHRLQTGIFDKTKYYSPTHHGPIFNKNKILTVHDITPLLLKNKSFKQYFYYKYFLKYSIQNTKKIITVSNFTKNKLIETYQLEYKRDDIVVIHNATDIDEIQEEFVDNLPSKYLFIPGVHSEYKNYKRIIQAILDLNDPNLNLLITSNSEEVKQYCKKYPFVTVLSELTYGQIKYLYLHSIALIYPSLIEGFGFPALEAARLKIPIITTKNSSMEEFLKINAAVYIDPYSIQETKEAIKKILYDDNSKMIYTAYNNTLHLTWDVNAEQVIKIIRNTFE